jgi:hypothetical protein
VAISPSISHKYDYYTIRKITRFPNPAIMILLLYKLQVGLNLPRRSVDLGNQQGLSSGMIMAGGQKR